MENSKKNMHFHIRAGRIKKKNKERLARAPLQKINTAAFGRSKLHKASALSIGSGTEVHKLIFLLLRTVPPFATAHMFCAFRDIRVS